MFQISKNRHFLSLKILIWNFSNLNSHLNQKLIYRIHYILTRLGGWLNNKYISENTKIVNRIRDYNITNLLLCSQSITKRFIKKFHDNRVSETELAIIIFPYFVICQVAWILIFLVFQLSFYLETDSFIKLQNSNCVQIFNFHRFQV